MNFELSGFVEEDFVNYKKPSMFLGTCYCDWKCCKDAGYDVCQNKSLSKSKKIITSIESLYERYVANPITSAVVIGGLEPFHERSFDQVYNLIEFFRDKGDNSIFVIYTGYNKNEINKQVDMLSKFNNIIVKFGRYIPNEKSHYDEVLGVELASNNQYAERL